MADETRRCEAVTDWGPTREKPETWTFCGLPAVARYPAMGGGYMYLCEEHAKPHRSTGLAIGLEDIG